MSTTPLAASAARRVRCRRLPDPDHGALFTRVMHSRTGWIAVAARWAWLGLHLFSK